MPKGSSKGNPRPVPASKIVKGGTVVHGFTAKPKAGSGRRSY